MQIIKQPSNYSFSRNPVEFLIEVQSFSESVSFNLHISDGESHYEDVYTYQPYQKKENNIQKYFIDFDISEILEAFAQPLQAWNGSNNGIVQYTLEFLNSGDIFNGYVIQGGIPNEMFQKLKFDGQDIFNTRFRNFETLFLLTTRKLSDNMIFFRQSEMHNIVFFAEKNHQFSLKSGSNEFQIPTEAGQDYFCFFNIKTAFDALNPQNGIMWMWVDDNVVFGIEILPDPVSEEKYMLEFKNSLGVFERYLVSAEASIIPDISEKENYLTNETGYLQTKHLRATQNEKLQVSTGSKITEEMLLLTDLLISDEVYLLNGDERKICKVTAENFKFAQVQNLKESAMLTIDLMQSEENFLSNVSIPEKINFLANDLGEIITTDEGLEIIV
jgi:hypothetical protein